MAEYPPGLSEESKRSFARTEELFSKSISLWDDLEHLLQSSKYSIDEWIEVAKKAGGANAELFPAYLHAIKERLEHSKKRRSFERPRYACFNRISPLRLIKKV